MYKPYCRYDFYLNNEIQRGCARVLNLLGVSVTFHSHKYDVEYRPIKQNRYVFNIYGVTSFSAYVEMSTKLFGAKIDGL